MILRDVLVIGAGSAGSSAAFHLAKAGKKVALLEKSPLFLSKPCSGGIASSVQNWFPFDLKPVVQEIIKKVEFTYGLSDPVVANLSETEPFWIVRREALDEFIQAQAVNAGAEIFSPFKVSKLNKTKEVWEVSSDDGRQIEAKAIIIADGSNSPWPKLFNLGPKKQHHASTLSIRLKGRGNLKEGTTKFEFGLVHHGFAWAFPMQDGVHLGLGTFLSNNEQLDKSGLLEKLLPNLGFESTAGTRIESKLRVWNGHSNLHGDAILAIGDAASLCDPFLAEGLRPAILSGFEAAKYLNLWLQGDIENLDSYSKAIKSKWGNSMAWGKRISQIFYRFPRVGYQLGIKRPTAPKRISQILSGEMGYGDIAQRVIKRLLLQRS